MKKSLFGLLAIIFVAVSCKKDEKPTYIKDETGAPQTNVATNTAPQSSLLNQSGIQTSAPNPQVVTAPGMNPPHGQPNHRCDIPVGQPLNSKPAPQPTQPAAQNIPVQMPQPVQTPQPAVANTGPKPATNPAHGQPWHDCAKKVGDPL